jgi:hypothetical protein
MVKAFVLLSQIDELPTPRQWRYNNERVFLMCPTRVFGVVGPHPCHWIAKSLPPSENTAYAYNFYKITFQNINERSQNIIQKKRAGSIAECKFECELDLITEDWKTLCDQLSRTRATSVEQLKLKAQALLCLLPDDNDPAVVLAESLCADIVVT